MNQSELADPYLPPRTLPARRPFAYLAYGAILAVIFLTFVASSLMVWLSIRPSRVILERSPPTTSTGDLETGIPTFNFKTDLDIQATRGPVSERK